MIGINRKILQTVLRSDGSRKSLMNHISCLSSSKLTDRRYNDTNDSTLVRSITPGLISNSQILLRRCNNHRAFKDIPVKKPWAVKIVEMSPKSVQPYLRLMRVDRPIGML